MKKGISFLMTAMLLSCSALCVSCTENGGSSMVSGAGDYNFDTDLSELRKKEGIMLTLTKTPGGDMTEEEFNAKTEVYTVYFSGDLAYSNSANTPGLSDSDYRKAAEFADRLCKGALPEPVTDNGADMPSYSANAYDAEGTLCHLNLPNGDSLAEYSEVYRLVCSYFE